MTRADGDALRELLAQCAVSEPSVRVLQPMLRDAAQRTSISTSHVDVRIRNSGRTVRAKLQLNLVFQ